MKKFYFVALAIIGLNALINLSSCKKDEDVDSSDLSSIIVGVWEQDADDDIIVIEKNGTGLIYPSSEAYDENSKITGEIEWKYQNEEIIFNYAYVTNGSLDRFQESKLVPVSVSRNVITWEWYDLRADSWVLYKKWTWIRYN